MSSPTQVRTPSDSAGFCGIDGWLAIILIASVIVRLALIEGNAAGFWADESRYEVSLSAAVAVQDGRWVEAGETVLNKADHMGFKLLMIAPALGQLKWGWSNDIVAMLGSGVFSVLNILMVYVLVRGQGGAAAEARWAALLMASSTCMLYWSRHLVPYDFSLFIALCALAIVVAPKVSTARLILAGALGFGSFFSYNGSWLLVAYVLVVPTLILCPEWNGIIRRGGYMLIGFCGSFGLVSVATSFFGHSLIASYVGFSATITQGNFADGHIVLWRYLWSGEGGLLLAWLACILGFAIAVVRRDQIDARAWIWFGGVVVMGGGFVVFSNFAEKFVVYGRLVRMMVPFFSLLSAWVVYRIFADRSRYRPVALLLVAMIIGLAARNFSRPLQQLFPRAFVAQGRALIDQRVAAEPSAQSTNELLERFRFVYAEFLWPVPGPVAFGPHEVLLEAAHPLSYEPYLYEGFDRSQREAFVGGNVTMRLILLND